jgi:hypothetical protein
MDSERLKRIASGCLVLIVCFFAFLGLDNWFGSGPAIREVKQSISSVDSKQLILLKNHHETLLWLDRG